MSVLDMKSPPGAPPRHAGLVGNAARARAVMPTHIFVKLLFSTLAVALSVHMWRHR